jgi:hypothetical protein
MKSSLLNEAVVSKLLCPYNSSRFSKESGIISNRKVQLSLHTTVIAQEFRINWWYSRLYHHVPLNRITRCAEGTQGVMEAEG